MGLSSSISNLVVCVLVWSVLVMARPGGRGGHNGGQAVDRLPLFPDKSAWGEAQGIQQVIGHDGCTSKKIANKVSI